MRVVSLSLSFSMALIACGGSNGIPTKPPVTTDAKTACATLLNDDVAAYARCNSVPNAVAASVLFALSFSVEEYCAALETAITAGKVIYDAGALAQCETDIAAASCNATSDPASCAMVFSGKAMAGGACNNSVECADGNDCDTSMACPGVCVAPPAVGGDCSQLSCAAGLLCVYDFSTASFSATCMAALASGAACDPQVSACGAGLHCDPSTRTCLPLKTSGSCTSTSDCVPGDACGGAPIGKATTCRPAALEGATCTPGNGDCALGLSCNLGSCAAWPGIDGVCGFINNEVVLCTAGFCAGDLSAGTPGVCTATLALGAACDDSKATFGRECGAGATCSSTTGPGVCVVSSCYEQ